MPISKKMQDGINQQIVNELFSSNAYLAIAGYMDSQGLKVLAAHYLEQSAEERTHAMKLLHYLLDVGASLSIGAIPEPQNKFKSVEEAVKSALDQEEIVTTQINDLMGLAHTQKDYATVSFLQWFVDEQVEEISTASELLQLVRLAGSERILLVEDRLMKTGTAPLATKEP
ncbi:MAG: bacterioferritin [Candidatus Sumerlaeota bacterium]|nr:bacterioferritin [Candidatus Sumerlaeota bacterium]